MPLARTAEVRRAQAAVGAAAHFSAREGLHAWVAEMISGGVGHARMRPSAAAVVAVEVAFRCS